MNTLLIIYLVFTGLSLIWTFAHCDYYNEIETLWDWIWYSALWPKYAILSFWKMLKHDLWKNRLKSDKE